MRGEAIEPRLWATVREIKGVLNAYSIGIRDWSSVIDLDGLEYQRYAFAFKKSIRSRGSTEAVPKVRHPVNTALQIEQKGEGPHIGVGRSRGVHTHRFKETNFIRR